MSMVAKCINPYCHRPFRYLGHGKLFVTEYPPTLESGLSLHTRVREHFWLCEECSKSMTVAVRREHGRIAIRILNLSPNGRRKFDFIPEEQARPAVTTANRHPLPEFFFEAS
jgi:hypothetical protein